MVFLLRKAIPPMGQFDFRYEETPSGSTVPSAHRFEPNTPEYRERFPGIGRGAWTVASILEPRFAGRSFPTKREKPISAAEIFARDMLRIYEKELLKLPGNSEITFPIAKLYLMRANSELEPTHGWHVYPYWRNYPLSPEHAERNDIYKRTHATSSRDGGYYFTQQRVYPAELGGHPKDWAHSFHELSMYRHAFISSMMENVARNFLTQPQTKDGWIRAKERTWQQFQRSIQNNPVQAGIVTPDPNFRYGVDLPNERPFDSLPKQPNMAAFDESTPMAHPWFWQSLGKSRADFERYLNNPDPFPIERAGRDSIDFGEAFWLHRNHFNRNNQIRDPFENIRMLFEKERPYWSSYQNLQISPDLETSPIPIIGRGPEYTDEQLISTALRIFNHPSFRGSIRTGRVGGEETTGNPMDGVNLQIAQPRVKEDNGMFLGYEDAGKPTAKDFVPVIGDLSHTILGKIQNSRPSWLPEVDSSLSAEDQFEKDFQDTARIIAERDRSSQIARLSHSNRSRSGHDAFLERRDNPLHDAWGEAFAQGASWLAKKSQELGFNYTEKEFWDEFHQEIQNKHAEIDDSIGTIKLPQIPLESLDSHLLKINNPETADQIRSDIHSGNYEIAMDPNAGPAISSDRDPRNMGPTIATKLNSSDFGDHPFADDSQIHQEISHGLFADRDHEKFNSSVYRVFPHIRYATPSGETKIMSIPIGLHEGLTEMDESKPMTDSARARLSKSINSALDILKTSPSQIKKAQRFESNGQVLMEEDPGNQMAAFGAMNAIGSLMSSGQDMIGGVRDAMNQSSLTASTPQKPRISAKRIPLPSSKNAGRGVQIGAATPFSSPPRVGTATPTTAGGTPKRVNSGPTGLISSTQPATSAASPALPAPNSLSGASSLLSASPPRVSLPRRPSPPRLTRS